MKPSWFKTICWGNWLFFIIVIFLFIISLLSACGTKSDLYIPDEHSSTAST
jgi:predicted small lipoprotein YifL